MPVLREEPTNTKNPLSAPARQGPGCSVSNGGSEQRTLSPLASRILIADPGRVPQFGHRYSLIDMVITLLESDYCWQSGS